MRRGRIDEGVVFVEAAAFNSRALLLLVQELKVLCKHHDRCLSDNNKMTKILSPLDLLHICTLSQSEFLKNFLGGEIIQENRVVSTNNDLSEWSWVDHIDLVETFLIKLKLFDIRSIEVANRQLTIHVKNANLIL